MINATPAVTRRQQITADYLGGLTVTQPPWGCAPPRVKSLEAIAPVM